MRRYNAPIKEPFLAKSFRVSLAVHGALLVIFLFQGVVSRVFFSSSKEEQEAMLNAQMAKQAIRVDMVDLPRYKLSEVDQVDLSQEIGEENLQSPEELKKLEASSDLMKLNDEAMAKAAKEKEEAEKKSKLSQRDDKKLKEEEQKRLDELRARLRADNRRQELMGKLGGGRQILSGNKLSKGYSHTGDVATGADEYAGLLRAHVHKYWNVPAWMNASELKAIMMVKINPDGSLLKRAFIKKSGNYNFDSAVELAIENANPFPAPPKALARLYMEEGFQCGFPN